MFTTYFFQKAIFLKLLFKIHGKRLPAVCKESYNSFEQSPILYYKVKQLKDFRNFFSRKVSHSGKRAKVLTVNDPQGTQTKIHN